MRQTARASITAGIVSATASVIGSLSTCYHYYYYYVALQLYVLTFQRVCAPLLDVFFKVDKIALNLHFFVQVQNTFSIDSKMVVDDRLFLICKILDSSFAVEFKYGIKILQYQLQR
jgi:hypothetical protein